MGIFSRMADIVNSNLNALLDRAEDPEKMSRLIIQEMEDTLVEVRSSAVRLLADKKDLVRSIERMSDSQGEWATKAEFALSKGREDLAKGALVAKRRLGEQIETAQAELTVIEDSLNRTNEDLAKLQAKLEEAKAKRKSIEVRMRTAQKQVTLRKAIHDGRIDDAIGRYESLERRISELEADVDSYDMGRKPTLEEELASLRAETDIEDELAALRAKVGADKA